MFPHHGPPAWAQQQNSQNQAPYYWAQHGAYQQPPFIPPRAPQAPPPLSGGYHPGGIYGYQAHHPSNWSPQSAQSQESDPTDRRSQKWPKLSAILAADTTLARFKVSGQKPSQELFASTFYLYRNVPANATPTNRMRLFSKNFPWSIEISAQQDITCEIVWNAIWSSLQQPIEDSEWGLLCLSGEAGQARMKNILKANKKRLELNSYADKRVLRCDYLCDDAWFLGLEKDEEYQNARLMPHSDLAKQPVPDDTWLVKMGK